ncbi:MAG: hypothetical protein UR26_C0004G0040 [candidate division TM6 bacterium GW2011_GWF2_32_72]|nr:MAG: hypothetical protein UR26_C0004G0040 [candidate division TM6 bacterium GW2011_GWF2_32_72]
MKKILNLSIVTILLLGFYSDSFARSARRPFSFDYDDLEDYQRERAEDASSNVSWKQIKSNAVSNLTRGISKGLGTSLGDAMSDNLAELVRTVFAIIVFPVKGSAAILTMMKNRWKYQQDALASEHIEILRSDLVEIINNYCSNKVTTLSKSREERLSKIEGDEKIDSIWIDEKAGVKESLEFIQMVLAEKINLYLGRDKNSNKKVNVARFKGSKSKDVKINLHAFNAENKNVLGAVLALGVVSKDKDIAFYLCRIIKDIGQVINLFDNAESRTDLDKNILLANLQKINSAFYSISVLLGESSKRKTNRSAGSSSYGNSYSKSSSGGLGMLD